MANVADKREWARRISKKWKSSQNKEIIGSQSCCPNKLWFQKCGVSTEYIITAERGFHQPKIQGLQAPVYR